ncbi:SLC13 family permease [Nakamurella lactea]|uniref:SLC13 family permease n=1 Tax=Nakamurella lactea TaxID=459515 RepID=UPI00040AC395|nr:SLC13 family permease [Nakamurella lactea]
MTVLKDPLPDAISTRKKSVIAALIGLSLVIAIVFAVLGKQAGLWGLVPIVLYAALALMSVDVVLATAAALLVAAVMSRTGPLALGEQLATSLGSFVAVIGLIIMLGAGLGRVAQETGAAQLLVKVVMQRVGLSTPTRVQIGIMLSSLILVGALGTLAGANAILAPIVIPVAARMKWRPPAVAAMFHAAGAAGLMTGPFTPPVVTITGAAGISYFDYLLKAGLPVAMVTIVTGFFMARWIQRRVDTEYSAADAGGDDGDVTDNRAARRAAAVFVGVLLAMTVFGIVAKAGYSYALVVMVVTAALTGIAGGKSPKQTLEAIYAGAGRFIWLFILFWLLDPLLTLIGKTGTYDAVFSALQPILPTLSPFLFLAMIVGIGYLHAVPGAAVAQVVLINKLFAPVVASLGIPPAVWAVALLGTSQIDQLGPFPGADMIGQMGLARSNNLKMMLVNGWAIMGTNTVLFLVIFWAFG